MVKRSLACNALYSLRDFVRLSLFSLVGNIRPDILYSGILCLHVGSVHVLRMLQSTALYYYYYSILFKSGSPSANKNAVF